MINQKDLEIVLKKEKDELFSRIQSDFWQILLSDILKVHSYQKDYWLIQDNLTYKDVIEHLRSTFFEISKEYDLPFFMSRQSYRSELKLRFFYSWKLKKEIDDLSVVICENDITMRVLPHNPFFKMFRLDEYFLVETVAKKIYKQLFNQSAGIASSLQTEYEKIQSSSENLTTKTITIAQNSIKALYEATYGKSGNLVQRYLYTSLLCKNRVIRIFHKDFLENPDVLLMELRK